MTIARKRAKVKKKSPAVKKKRVVRRKKVPQKKKAQRKKPVATKRKKRVSVNTKRKPPSKPKPSKSKSKKPKLAKKRPGNKLGKKKKRPARPRTPPQAVSEPDKQLIQFLAQPAVKRQIEERLIEKFDPSVFTRGMVRTVESQMLAALIVAEQLGNFDARANELAAEYNWNVQDVYTLWFSP